MFSDAVLLGFGTILGLHRIDLELLAVLAVDARVTIVALAEEDEPGADLNGQPVGATTTATSAAAVASQPQRVGNRVVVKRKRNPEVVKKLTMKFPDPRKTDETA